MAVAASANALLIPWRSPANPIVKGVWVRKLRVAGDASGGGATLSIVISDRVSLDRFTVEQVFPEVTISSAQNVNVSVENWASPMITGVQNFITRSNLLVAGATGSGWPPQNHGPFFSFPMNAAVGQNLVTRAIFDTNAAGTNFDFTAWGYVIDMDLMNALTALPTTVPPTR